MKSDMRDREQLCIALETIDAYQRFLQRLRYDADWPTEEKPNCFGFIPQSSRYVLEALFGARTALIKTWEEEGYSHRRAKFLDASCGAGNVMLLAHRCGFDVHGIDSDKETIKLARKLTSNCQIIEADLLEYKGYDEYDIIYFYRPIKNGNLMEEFAAKVADQISINSIILPFCFTHLANDKRFKRYGGGFSNVYQKRS